jgi:hypothetical protein
MGSKPVTGAAHTLGQLGHPGDAGSHRMVRRRVAACTWATCHARHTLQRGLDRVGTGCAVHALHHQHRSGTRSAVLLLELGEFALLDRVIEHGKVVGDGQRATMPAQNPIRKGIARFRGVGYGA